MKIKGIYKKEWGKDFRINEWQKGNVLQAEKGNREQIKSERETKHEWNK